MDPLRVARIAYLPSLLALVLLWPLAAALRRSVVIHLGPSPRLFPWWIRPDEGPAVTEGAPNESAVPPHRRHRHHRLDSAPGSRVRRRRPGALRPLLAGGRSVPKRSLH